MVYTSVMKLINFLKNLPTEEREVFAAKCDTTYRFLRNIAYGYRRAGESLCINIERESGGKVLCEELRPDVDWSYLRGTARTHEKKSICN